MAKQKISVVVTYDEKMKGSFGYTVDRIISKIDKVLGEYSKEVFNGSFVISPVQIKEVTEKGNVDAKTIR